MTRMRAPNIQSKGKGKQARTCYVLTRSYSMEGGMENEQGCHLKLFLARVLRELEDDFTHYKRSVIGLSCDMFTNKTLGIHC